MDDADLVSFVSIEDRENGPGEADNNTERKILDSDNSLIVNPLESRESTMVKPSPNTPKSKYRTSLSITPNENLLGQKSDMMTKPLILDPSLTSPSKFTNTISHNYNMTDLENTHTFDTTKIETIPLLNSPRTFQLNIQRPLQSNSLIHYFTTLLEGRASLHGMKPKSRNIGTLILKQELDQIPESHMFTGWKPLFPSPKIFKSLTDRVSKRLFLSAKVPLITESAKLENSVFSPKTHRPNVVDFPTIETIEDVYRANHGVCSYFATIFFKTNLRTPIPSCLRQSGRKGSHRSLFKPLQVKFDLPPQSEIP